MRRGHPLVFTLAQRREIKKIAKSAPADHASDPRLRRIVDRANVA